VPDTPGMPPPGGPGQFSQRIDQSPGQPIRVPTGLPYGKAKQLEQAQSAVPLPASPGGASLPSPGPSAPAPGPIAPPAPPMGGGPSGSSDMANALSLLSHPTQRPNEPVTAPPSLQQPPVVSQSMIIAALEGLIAHSPSVPENVMRLYQGLRAEAAKAPGF